MIISGIILIFIRSFAISGFQLMQKKKKKSQEVLNKTENSSKLTRICFLSLVFEAVNKELLYKRMDNSCTKNKIIILMTRTTILFEKKERYWKLITVV